MSRLSKTNERDVRDIKKTLEKIKEKSGFTAEKFLTYVMGAILAMGLIKTTSATGQYLFGKIPKSPLGTSMRETGNLALEGMKDGARTASKKAAEKSRSLRNRLGDAGNFILHRRGRSPKKPSKWDVVRSTPLDELRAAGELDQRRRRSRRRRSTGKKRRRSRRR
jgi:hypothetical protein